MDAAIRIWPDVQTARVNPNLFGHFAEHLGECIYGGIWVGEDASIPNTRGIRNDVVAALRKIKPPVVRWPGGCFADYYHWQDGIGPRDKRPRRVNLSWGEVIEPNSFGTHEFIDFCNQIGAEPYLCGNVGSGSPRELAEWVESCNYPGDSTLARQRSANGHPEPMAVSYWGIGNENWGCGGNFKPEEYAAEYRRFATYLRDFGTSLYRIACGPAGHNKEWTRRFFDNLGGRAPANGYAPHFYTSYRHEGGAGTATEYTDVEWYRLLARCLNIEPLIVEQRALLDSYDPQRRIGLIIDEWGAWHPPTEGRNPKFLWQQNTMRDALVAALTLNVFVRHADKIVMGNIAQTINVLQAMCLTEEDRMITTPTYHVFEMYVPHQGATSVRIECECGRISFGPPRQEIPAAHAAASLRDRSLFLSIANPSASDVVAVRIDLRDSAAPKAITRRVLAADDIHAHNTFDEPERVTPQNAEPMDTDRKIAVELPPASLTTLDIELQ